MLVLYVLIDYQGDVWAETTHFGFKWHYYAMMEDRIFDITEWAACQVITLTCSLV